MLSKLILAVLAGAAAVNVRQTEERTLIHPERREQLNKIKAMATTWTAKAGRWAREAPGASAPVLGHLGDNKLNVAAAKERGEIVDFVPKLVNPIPDSFDSAEGMAQVRQADQRHPRPEQLWLLLGLRWRRGGERTACASLRTARRLCPISAQDVCFNSNLNGCNGGQITTPWTYIRWRGAVSGGSTTTRVPFGNMGLCSNWGFAHCHHHGPQRDDPYPDEGAEGCKSDKSPPGPTKCDNTAKGSHADFKGDKYKREPSVAANA